MEATGQVYGVYEVDLGGSEELVCLFWTEEDAMEFIAAEEVEPADFVMRSVNVYEMKNAFANISEDTRWTICEGGD